MKLRTIPFLFVLPIWVVTTQAREEPGIVIENLVDRIETNLSLLEESVSTRNEEQLTRRESLQQMATAYEQAPNEQERLRWKSRIVEELSELNLEDRLLIHQTLRTLVEVSLDLDQLHSVYADGFLSEENLQQRRQQLRNVIRNVGPILGVLSDSMTDPSSKQRAAMSEQTLLMVYQQLAATSSHNSEGLLSHIESTTEALQEVIAQLSVVTQLLDLERYQLEVVAKINVAEILFARLGEVRFGDRPLIEAPRAFQEGVEERNALFGDVLRSSLGSPQSVRSRPEDRDLLRQLLRGEIPNE